MRIRANRGAQLPVLEIVQDQQNHSAAISLEGATSAFRVADREYARAKENRKLAELNLKNALKYAIGSSDLTNRETEVLSLVREGLANKEIADRLNLCVRTIKFHVSSLLDKFDVGDRSKL